MPKFLWPVVSGVLLYLSFHPVNAWPLAWGALVPLIVYILREPSGRRAFFAGWLGGAVFFVAGDFWVRHTTGIGPWGIGAYLGLYWGLFAIILRRLCLRGRWPVPISAAITWVTLEYVRGYLIGGFPWLLTGYTQHASLAVIQVADLGGVWLVSMLVLFVNGAAAEGILKTGDRSRLWSAAALASVLVAMVYGAIRLSSIPTETGPVIGIVQPNIPQDVKEMIKRDPVQTMVESQKIFDKHERLTRELIAKSPDVALIAWPESVLLGGLAYEPSSGRFVGRWMESLSRVARESQRPLLAGVLIDEVEWTGPQVKILARANAALLLDATGAVVARYDKNRLVQFTETMPFEPVIPVTRIVEMAIGGGVKLAVFRPGTESVVFDIGGRTLGVSICSENTYPDISRKIAGKGASAIVNISNEAWFLDSAELDLMFAMAKFHAIENRAACVRATNSGISTALDAGGRPVAVLEGAGGARKTVEGTMAVAVPAGPGGTVYGAAGDAAVGLAAAAVMIGLVVAAFSAKR